MSDQTSVIPADVRLFLAAVRRELADVDPEELTEITDGLEADLADLVAERGPAALGDPKAYAQELRTAAGIASTARKKGPRRSAGESATGFLDACHAWVDEQVGRLPGDPKPVLDWLRPTWWIVRAAIAALLLSWMLGSTDVIWPALVVGVPVSILIGIGRFWPGNRKSVGARLLLLGLNLFAVAMLPVALGIADSAATDDGWSSSDAAWEDGYQSGLSQATGGSADGSSENGGLFLNGKQVTNIYPYDSQGRRMAGVQLFDQDGKPLNTSKRAVCPKHSSYQEQYADGGEGLQDACVDDSNGNEIAGFVPYPWTNGQAQLLNVFPVAMREQVDLKPSATAFQEKDRPALGEWPFGEVPRVSLPGITSGVLEEEKPATTP